MKGKYLKVLLSLQSKKEREIKTVQSVENDKKALHNGLIVKIRENEVNIKC